MDSYLIKNTLIVNEKKQIAGDLLIRHGRIEKIGGIIERKEAITEIDGSNQWLIPGVIDDQVHFREPGLTHKATIYSEAKAAIAGGVTSFMEMPNTVPPAFTHTLLEEKYAIGKASSLANYSFYMGTSSSNLDEVLRTNDRKRDICGVKIFMGSSTGNLLVDDPLVLERIFGGSEILIATHCEEERMIRANLAAIKQQKEILEAADHPIIRDAAACFESSFKAIQLAKKHAARLHILHITSGKELPLFGNMLPLEDKRITAEVCVHHLHFTADDYGRLGNKIKCNPAIKSADNKAALWEALLDDRLDVIATDHAPHTLAEKSGNYEQAHAGLPLVQHGLLLMLDYVAEGKISIEKVVEKMSHAVAVCFQIKDRGFIREGYFADVVLVNPNSANQVSASNILYKCGWSPFEGHQFGSSITHTFVNGRLVYGKNGFDESVKGMRLQFDR